MWRAALLQDIEQLLHMHGISSVGPQQVEIYTMYIYRYTLTRKRRGVTSCIHSGA